VAFLIILLSIAFGIYKERYLGFTFLHLGFPFARFFPTEFPRLGKLGFPNLLNVQGQWEMAFI